MVPEEAPKLTSDWLLATAETAEVHLKEQRQSPSCCFWKKTVQKVVGVGEEGGKHWLLIPSLLYCRQFHSCVVNSSRKVAHKGGFIRRQKER